VNRWTAKAPPNRNSCYAQRLAATVALIWRSSIGNGNGRAFAAERLQQALVASGGRDRLVARLSFGEHSCGGGTNLFGANKRSHEGTFLRGIVI